MNIERIKTERDYKNSLHRIKQLGLTRKDLKPFVDSRRISEIFSKKRNLS